MSLGNGNTRTLRRSEGEERATVPGLGSAGPGEKLENVPEHVADELVSRGGWEDAGANRPARRIHKWEAAGEAEGVSGA